MNILGVHYDFPFLRIARIRKTRKAVDILETKAISLLEDEENTPKGDALFILNVKRLYMKGFRAKVVSGLSPKDFLIRPIDMKIASQKHIEDAIAFQSEALSHFKPGEAITIPLVEKKEKGKAQGLLFTIPKQSLKQHLDALEKLHIDPDVVSTVPSAVCHFIRWKFPNLSDAFLVDLGSNAITCTLLEKGHLKKAHAIPMGIEDLLAAIYEDRKRTLLKKETEGAAKQIDLLLLKPQLNPRLFQELSALKQELAKIYFSFTRELAKPVIFTGRCDTFIHLREFLIEFSPSQWPLSFEEQKSAVSVGLALGQTAKNPIQLRREEFFPRKNWSRMGLIALCLLSLSIFLSAGLIWLGTQFVNAGKKQMLGSLQKDFISEKNMEDQIDQWIYAIEKNNKEYPYISQAPKVSEILSWLSSHPLLEELKEQGDPIDIRQIRTQLVHFPAIHAENEPYLAKVEMEFSFKSMMNSRKFHEALRKGDYLVNPKLEITWDALNDGYRTSFFLKNRSPYVP